MLLPRRARLSRVVAPIAVAAACTLAGEAPALAQGKTTTTLIQRGGTLFEDQQYEESIQTLSAALLRPGSSEAEKIETYRLLAYNYIILKRTEEADAAVRGLLVLNEAFSLPPTESPRFRDFFDATRKKWADEGKPGVVTVGVVIAPDKPIHRPLTALTNCRIIVLCFSKSFIQSYSTQAPSHQSRF